MKESKKFDSLSIKLLMEKGIFPSPYEITEQDFWEYRRIDALLGGGFGFVQKIDIGKRVFLRGGVIQMENDEQMKECKHREAYFPKTNLRLEK